jgi:hypothetical protein
MTGKADFTPEEWKVVLEGPPSAALIVVTAQHGGTFRESFSIAKAYSEARQDHGDSELLDELASAKPEIDHTRYHSFDELKADFLDRLRKALELVQRKGTAEELAEYKRFVQSLSERVASAHREGFMGLRGDRVSDAERAAVDEIGTTLGETGRSSDG